MKLSSVKYLTWTGLKNMWVNKLMTFASIGTLVACMLIMGVAVMISANVTNLLKGIERQNVIMVFFNDYNSVEFENAEPLVPWPEKGEFDEERPPVPYDAYLIHNKEEAMQVIEEIKKLENVESVEYVSKEEFLEIMKDKYLDGKDEAQGVLDEKNPFSDGAKITVNDMSLFSQTADELKTVRGVTTVTEQRDVAEKIVGITGALKTAGFWIIAVLLVISLVIVSNTIRVTIYNRKLEITIMKAVGATNSFIRLPFVIEGIAIGLISSGIAFGLIYLLQNAITDRLLGSLAKTSLVPFGSYALLILGIFVALGLVAGVFGSVVMMGKYLRKEGSEFRAL